jgi:hypothetical protein
LEKSGLGLVEVSHDIYLEALLATCFHAGFCSVYSSTLKMEAIYSIEISVDFNELRGVICQKIVIFIATALSTSNPKEKSSL